MNNEYKILIEQISKRVLLLQENNNIINIIDRTFSVVWK